MTLMLEDVIRKRYTLIENVLMYLGDNEPKMTVWRKCVSHISTPIRNQIYIGINNEIEQRIINEIIN